MKLGDNARVVPVVPANATLRANTRTFDVTVQEGNKTGRLSISETVPTQTSGPVLLSPMPNGAPQRKFYVAVFEITHIAGKRLAEPMGGQLTEDLFTEATSIDEATAIAKVFFFEMWANLDTAFWTGKLPGVAFK